MTRSIGPDGRHADAPHLIAQPADSARPAVSILSDLSPGRVQLAPAARPGRWKWVLPPLLVALAGGGFLLGRQAPEPTAATPEPAAPPAGTRPALPIVAETPQMPPAPIGAGAIIREPSPEPPGPGVPETTAGPGESIGAHPPASPRPSPPRSAATSRARPSGEAPAPQTAHPTLARPAAPPPGQATPNRAAERDVDIITAIVR